MSRCWTPGLGRPWAERPCPPSREKVPFATYPRKTLDRYHKPVCLESVTSASTGPRRIKPETTISAALYMHGLRARARHFRRHPVISCVLNASVTNQPTHHLFLQEGIVRSPGRRINGLNQQLQPPTLVWAEKLLAALLGECPGRYL